MYDKENTCVRIHFFITKIYTIGNNKTLTHFFVGTNPLLGTGALVTGNNGTGSDNFSQETKLKTLS